MMSLEKAKESIEFWENKAKQNEKIEEHNALVQAGKRQGKQKFLSEIKFTALANARAAVKFHEEKSVCSECGTIVDKVEKVDHLREGILKLISTKQDFNICWEQIETDPESVQHIMEDLGWYQSDFETNGVDIDYFVKYESDDHDFNIQHNGSLKYNVSGFLTVQ